MTTHAIVMVSVAGWGRGSRVATLMYCRHLRLLKLFEALIVDFFVQFVICNGGYNFIVINFVCLLPGLLRR